MSNMITQLAALAPMSAPVRGLLLGLLAHQEDGKPQTHPGLMHRCPACFAIFEGAPPPAEWLEETLRLNMAQFDRLAAKVADASATLPPEDRAQLDGYLNNPLLKAMFVKFIANERHKMTVDLDCPSCGQRFTDIVT